MRFFKTWEKYMLKELIKFALLFISCFFSLYVLIDYATHARSFYHASYLDLGYYYFQELVRRAHVLIPFALLLSTIRLLCFMNKKHELVALTAGGIAIKRILRPLILAGLFFALSLFLAEETLIPKIIAEQKSQSLAKLKKKHQTDGVQHVYLKDRSLLLFQKVDLQGTLFEDVWWVASHDELWHMEQMENGEIAMGQEVSHFLRKDGSLVLDQSFPTYSFDTLKIDEIKLLDQILDPNDLSISDLYKEIARFKEEIHEKKAAFLSALLQKMITPLFCLLAVLIPIPWSVKFTRNLPQLMIYALSLFLLAAIYIVLDAGQILSQRQVLSAWSALMLPFGILFSIVLFRFIRV